MSEEEAIESLKEYIKIDKVCKKNEENLSDFDTFCINHCKAIETVLNMLEETKANEYESNNIISDLLDEMKKQDKIINEMAKAFKQDDVRSVDEIIKYFKEKVENEEK